MTVSISRMSIDYYLSHAATGDGQARDLTSYYTDTQAPQGQWFGRGMSGLDTLRSGDAVTQHDARSLYEDMTDPHTGQRLGRAKITTQTAPDTAKTPSGQKAKSSRSAVAGFDLTFSPPKSVSALWAVSPPALQGRLHAAHRRAVEDTLRWVENEVLQTRTGHGGVAHVETRGMLASIFDHWDSRTGDPQLHSHVVIANRVQRKSDGGWATLDSYTLHRHVVAISEMYTNVLFDQLARDVGAEAESRDGEMLNMTDLVSETLPDSFESHRVELAGVPDDLIDEFSTRSAQIRKLTDELIADYRDRTGHEPDSRQIIRFRQQATLETRPSKDTIENVTLADKILSWQSRARDTGITPEALIADAVGRDVTLVSDEDVSDTVLSDIAQWVLKDAATRRTTFTRANLRASAERLLRLVRCRSFNDRVRLVDVVTDHAVSEAVALSPTRSHARSLTDPSVSNRGHSVYDNHLNQKFTSTETLDNEKFLIDRTASTTGPVATGETLTEWRSPSGHALSNDQYTAAHHVLTTTSEMTAIIGPAGTGKTTTMSALTEAWQHEHGDGSIIGLAPSAAAAKVLGAETGMATENTAKWIYETTGDGARRRMTRIAELEKTCASLPTGHPKYERLHAQLAHEYATHDHYTFRENQLIVIDEASMCATRDLADLARRAHDAGAKICLVGDPAQLDSVDAGGFLGYMERHLTPARLTQVWRMRNEWEKKASLLLRDGNYAALDDYVSHNRVHASEDSTAADQAFEAWKNDVDNGLHSLLIAPHTSHVHALNERAQASLIDEGVVDPSSAVPLRHNETGYIGDTILARTNNRGLRDSHGHFIANGTRMTITSINDDGSVSATVDDTDAHVTIDADYLSQSCELGYAVTAHRAQGLTVDSAHMVIDSHTVNREALYVGMTRGKTANHVYVDGPDPEHGVDPWGMIHQTGHHPDEEPDADQHAYDTLSRILAASGAPETAHEVQAAEHGWANDLGRLCHAAAHLQREAQRIRTDSWVRETFSPETVSHITSDPEYMRLVAADPAETFVGDATTADIDSLLAQCHPATPEKDSVVPHVLPATDDQRREWEDLRRRITHRIDVVHAQLTDDPPDWLLTLRESTHLTPEAEQALIVWRSVSDQDDAPTTYGHIPTPRDYLRPWYDRTRAVMSTSTDTLSTTNADTTRSQDAPPDDDLSGFTWDDADCPDDILALDDLLPPPDTEPDTPPFEDMTTVTAPDSSHSLDR